MFSGCLEKAGIWRDTSQWASRHVTSALIISHLLFTIVFSFRYGFYLCVCRFDHSSSNLCKLASWISLCCKRRAFLETCSASVSMLPWAVRTVIGCTAETYFPGGRRLLLTFKSASGYSLKTHSRLSHSPPPAFLCISVTKPSLKLLIKLMKLTFLF